MDDTTPTTDTAPEATATIVCTVELTDDGPACAWCGYRTGPGHGKRR